MHSANAWVYKVMKGSLLVLLLLGYVYPPTWPHYDQGQRCMYRGAGEGETFGKTWYQGVFRVQAMNSKDSAYKSFLLLLQLGFMRHCCTYCNVFPATNTLIKCRTGLHFSATVSEYGMVAAQTPVSDPAESG